MAQRSKVPGEVTVTLWNSGTAPVSWAASADVPWLRLSAVSGILAPGAQTTMRITVDHAAEPSTPWQAHVRFDPSGQMIALNGSGNPGPPEQLGQSAHHARQLVEFVGAVQLVESHQPIVIPGTPTSPVEQPEPAAQLGELVSSQSGGGPSTGRGGPGSPSPSAAGRRASEFASSGLLDCAEQPAGTGSPPPPTTAASPRY